MKADACCEDEEGGAKIAPSEVQSLHHSEDSVLCKRFKRAFNILVLTADTTDDFLLGDILKARIEGLIWVSGDEACGDEFSVGQRSLCTGFNQFFYMRGHI
jgi:hypothetical protein